MSEMDRFSTGSTFRASLTFATALPRLVGLRRNGVGVDVQSGADPGVAQAGRHDRSGDAGVERLGRHEVAKVVEPELAELGRSAHPVKRLVTKLGDQGRVPALSELKTKRFSEAITPPPVDVAWCRFAAARGSLRREQPGTIDVSWWAHGPPDPRPVKVER